MKADILLSCPVSGEQTEKHVVAVGAEPVNTGEGGSEFAIPTQASCPGGEFQIAFNDGVNSTGFIDAGPPVLDVDTAPPVAAITGPRPGDVFLSSRAVGRVGHGPLRVLTASSPAMRSSGRSGTRRRRRRDGGGRGPDVHARRRQPTPSS